MRETDHRSTTGRGPSGGVPDGKIPLARRIWLLVALVVHFAAGPAAAAPSGLGVPIVFVSRQIPPDGSVYWNAAKGLAGAGPASRVQPAAPGKLLVLEANGTVRTLVDGANPTAWRLYKIRASDLSGSATLPSRR